MRSVVRAESEADAATRPSVGAGPLLEITPVIVAGAKSPSGATWTWPSGGEPAACTDWDVSAAVDESD